MLLGQSSVMSCNHLPITEKFFYIYSNPPWMLSNPHCSQIMGPHTSAALKSPPQGTTHTSAPLNKNWLCTGLGSPHTPLSLDHPKCHCCQHKEMIFNRWPLQGALRRIAPPRGNDDSIINYVLGLVTTILTNLIPMKRATRTSTDSTD